MDYELFVINAIQTSERAFSIVAEFIPTDDKRALLKILRNKDRLRKAALDMRIPHEKIFEFLKNQIENIFNQIIIPNLTKKRFFSLLDSNIQRDLAELLGCPYQEALQTLFNIPALQDTLDYLTGGLQTVISGDAIYFLNELKTSSMYQQQLELDYTASANDWEPIIDGENWIDKKAADKLMMSHKLANVKTPCQALSVLIELASKEQSHISEIDMHKIDVIRPLGLIEIRRRLSWIIKRLYDQAIENINNVSMYMAGSPLINLLESIIYINELGANRKGLQTYLENTHVLRHLLPKENIVIENIEEEYIVDDEPLLFVEGALYEKDQRKVGKFDIKCKLQKKRQAQLILRASDVPFWVYEQLKKDIPQLTPSKLNRYGKTIGDKLLNTSFPILEPHVQLLRQLIGKDELKMMRPESAKKISLNKIREYLSELFPEKTIWKPNIELVQAIALSSDILISNVPKIIDDSTISKHLYKDLPTEKDPLYSYGINEIIQFHQNNYGKQTINVVREKMNIFHSKTDKQRKQKER